MRGNHASSARRSWRGAPGVVTGAGRQATGALINFCTYWGVGLSLAATLAFYARLGVRGLWYGVMAGSGTQRVTAS